MRGVLAGLRIGNTGAASRAAVLIERGRARNVVILAALALSLGACASVKPWERGTLARPEMQLDSNPLQTGLYEQVYDSKEAAGGATKAAGAGCGCN